MIKCPEFFRRQLSQAYEAARKVISTPEIEKDIIVKAKAGDRYSRDMLFNLYIPMVMSYVNSPDSDPYSGDFGDLMSAATLGFNRALDLFDTSRGFEFGCYYKWHIGHHIRKEIYADSDVHCPENLIKPKKKFTVDENGNRVTVTRPFTIISGDSPVGDEDGRSTLMETLSSGDPDSAEIAASKDTERIVHCLLDNLPKIERDAVTAMIMSDEHVTTREWGASHKCSHEWARKVKNRAMKHMKEQLDAINCYESMAV